MKLLVNWIVYAIIFMAVGYFLPGIHINDFLTAFVAVLVLAIVNTFLKPILVVLTLPINLVTIGLFTWIINAALVYLTSLLVPGFQVDGFLWAIAFSFLLSLANSAVHHVFK